LRRDAVSVQFLEARMLDLVFIAIGVVTFAGLALYARGLGKV